MVSDMAGWTDEILIQLNPLPERPENSASEATWIEYVVALGGDYGFTSDGLTKEELMELANRFGG